MTGHRRSTSRSMRSWTSIMVSPSGMRLPLRKMLNRRHSSRSRRSASVRLVQAPIDLVQLLGDAHFELQPLAQRRRRTARPLQRAAVERGDGTRLERLGERRSLAKPRCAQRHSSGARPTIVCPTRSCSACRISANVVIRPAGAALAEGCLVSNDDASCSPSRAARRCLCRRFC